MDFYIGEEDVQFHFTDEEELNSFASRLASCAEDVVVDKKDDDIIHCMNELKENMSPCKDGIDSYLNLADATQMIGEMMFLLMEYHKAYRRIVLHKESQ